MVGIGGFGMLIRIKAHDEYSDKLDKARVKTDEFGTSTEKTGKSIENMEKRAFRTNAMLGIMGATMVMNSMYTLGLVDRQSELGKTLNTVFGITQLLIGVTAILNALHLKAIAHTVALTAAKIGKAVAAWAEAAAETAAAAAGTMGIAVPIIIAAIAAGVGAIAAYKAGWFQTSPGEYKIVPQDMLGVVHKGEVIGRPIANNISRGGDVYLTQNIYESNNPFQTARETAYQIEVLKRRGR